MAFIDLASFPNSRIKPRPATRISVENKVFIPAGDVVLVRPELAERTNLTVYVDGSTPTTVIKYKRGTDANINTEGFILATDRAIDLEGPQSLYMTTNEDVTIYYDDSIG